MFTKQEKQLIEDLLTCTAVIFEHCDQKDQPIIESILNKLINKPVETNNNKTKVNSDESQD